MKKKGIIEKNHSLPSFSSCLNFSTRLFQLSIATSELEHPKKGSYGHRRHLLEITLYADWENRDVSARLHRFIDKLSINDLFISCQGVVTDGAS